MAFSPDHLAAVIRGERREWNTLGVAPEELLAACARHDVSGLIYERTKRSEAASDWPASVLDALGRSAHAEAAAELIRGEEIRAVLRGLAEAGLRPILLKGAPLAYSVYETPSCRPRGDTDLLVRPDEVDAARKVMAAQGYRATVHCDDLFSQFEVQKEDRFGIAHAFDIHWKVSTQPIFANLLSHEELEASARPVPALGPHARAAGPLHALLLACVHPVMHHQNAERLLWIYDIHLLASGMSELERFGEMAVDKKMAAVCARSLRLAQTTFQTRLPAAVLPRLLTANGAEPSAAYLGENRRWHHEQISIVRSLPGWRDRFQHVRDVLLPSPRYILGAYGLAHTATGPMLLPALYLHRALRGAWKMLAGRK